MAFNAENLATIAQAVSADVFFRMHVYSELATAIGDIDAAGYFVTVGSSATGTKQIHTGDRILVFASDKTTGIWYKVSDGDAGTIVVDTFA